MVRQDRRKSHWKFLIDKQPKISSNRLGPPASEKFTDELTGMLRERLGFLEQDHEGLRHQLLDDEGLDRFEEKDQDWILKGI